jgi:hypothetical protein
MAAVKNSVSASKDALAAIFGKGSAKAQVGSKAEQEEPPSGTEGKGTVDEPYDQGNAPEQGMTTKTALPVSNPVILEPGQLTMPHSASIQPKLITGRCKSRLRRPS